jgi:hypothetical protein
VNHDIFFDQVRKHFRYLVEDYGFSVVEEEVVPSFDNRIVVLRSNDCSIRIVRDRGDVLIHVASRSASETGWRDSPRSASETGWRDSPAHLWFDVGTVIAFLSPRSEARKWQWFYASPDTALDRDASTDWQLAKLAAKLQPKVEQVCQLFQEDVLRQKWRELEEFRERRKRESWRQAMREN